MNIDLNNWNNILLIGDPVILFILKKKNDKLCEKKLLFPIEYCLYDLNAEHKFEKIKELIYNIEKHYNCKSALVIKSDRIECVIDEPYQCVIIYTHIFNDINDVIDSQSIDCRCVAYDGIKVHYGDRFNDTICTNEHMNMTSEDYVRVLYYKEYGFKLHLDQNISTLLSFDKTQLKNHSLGYIYKNKKKFTDILSTVIKYYKTLTLESIQSLHLENANCNIYYYYEKIDYITLYNDHNYNYLIMSSDTDLLNIYLNQVHDKSSSDKTINRDKDMIYMDKVLDDLHIDDIMLDNVKNINNNGFDLSGRSPLYISLLYRSVKTSLYLYEDKCKTLDLYNNIDSMHILCKEGITDLINLPDDKNKYLQIDEFGLTAYLYTLIFNKYAMFKIITDKFQDKINFKYLLRLAIILNRKEVVMNILGYGFDINSKLIDDTPLNLSIKYGNIDVFNILISKEVDLYTVDSANNTPVRIVMDKINNTSDKIYKNMLNILLDKRIDLQKDFFFKYLLETNSEWMIDNIVAKYYNDLDIKHHGTTLLSMVKNKINKLLENSSNNDFVTSEIKPNIDTLQLNCMKYLKRLLEINHVQKNTDDEFSNNNKTYYFLSFDGYKNDTVNEHIQYTDLFSSVWNLDFDRFKVVLLDNKLDLNVKTSETNRTLFHICFERDSFEIFKFIMEVIESSINDSAKFEEYINQFFITHDTNHNLLLYAFQHNSIQCLNYLLHNSNNAIKNIVSVCLNDNRGFLKYALINQNIELVSYLLRIRITGELPVSKCSDRFLEKLGISNSANNLMLDCIRTGALKSLFYLITKLPTIVKEFEMNNILTNIFKVDYVDTHGKNYLHHLCMVNYPTEKLETVYNIVKMFHKMDTELINHTDHAGKTPLFYACVGKDHILIQLLLQIGTDVDIVDEMGWSAFHYLVSDRSFIDKRKISVFIRSNSLSLNNKTLYEKQTPLILASKMDIPEYIHTLIQLKVNTHSVDILGNMYIHYVMYNGSEYARNIKIDYHENNFGMTPLECIEVKIKKELFNKNFDTVSKIIDIYDKHSKIYTHRIICKKENMIKMRQNLIKLIDNKKLFVIQNLVMP
mgnify:CR=1 FL=1